MCAGYSGYTNRRPFMAKLFFSSFLTIMLIAVACAADRTLTTAAVTVNAGEGAISVQNAPDINPGAGDFTIAFKIKAPEQTKAHILSKSGWAFNSYSAYVEGGRLWVEMKLPNPPGKGYRLGVASSAVLDGTWHQVTAVFTRSAKATLLIDGKAVDSRDMSDSAGVEVSNEADLLIGRGPAGGFTGALNEVRIYQRVFSAGESTPEIKPAALTPGKAVQMNPVIDSIGTIRIADRKFVYNEGIVSLYIADEPVFEGETFWEVRLAPGRSTWEKIDSRNITAGRFDAGTRTHSAEGKVKGRDGVPENTTFKFAVSLEDDGKIRYRVQFFNLKDNEMPMKTVNIRFPASVLAGKKIMNGDDEYSIGSDYQADKRSIQFKSPTVTMPFDDKDRTVTFTVVSKAKHHRLNDERSGGRKSFDYWIGLDENNAVELIIDIAKVDPSKLSAAAVPAVSNNDPLEFERYNLAELPNYRISRNMVQNPSFEEGFHGWQSRQWSTTIADTNHAREALVIDGTSAYHGSKSVRFRFKKGTDPNPARPYQQISAIAPYTMQLTPGKKYTISFYAKAAEAGVNVGFMGISKKWPQWVHSGNMKITTEWKRYTSTFTSKDAVGQFYFLFDYGAITGDVVDAWLDAVQIEEGDTAAAFTAKPFALSLLRTPSVLFTGDKKAIVFEAVAMSDSALTADVSIDVRDAFKHSIITKEFKGVVAAPGKPAVFTIDPGVSMDTIGLYSIKATIKGHDYSDYDFYRIAVIEPFSKERLLASRNRLIFSWGLFPGCDVGANVRLARMLGCGGMEANNFVHCSKQMYDVLANEGIMTFAQLIDDGNNPRYFPDQERIMKLLHSITDFDGPEMKEVTEWFRKYLRSVKHFKYWKYVNEPRPESADVRTFYNPKNIAAVMKKLYPVIREEIPGAVIIAPDPANNSEPYRRWLDVMMENGGDGLFDVLAIHPYREKPESPSLELDSEAFIALADKHKFKGDLWYSEGGYYALTHLPPLGISPFKMLSGDAVRFDKFTDDLIGNRVGLARHMRTILTTLRYSDRITMFLNWTTGNLFIESLNQIPTEIGVAYNSIAHLLGNARFVKDYRYTDTVRTYLFDDGAGRAVVALWDFDDNLENRRRDSLRFKLASGKDVRILDSFGRALPAADENGCRIFNIDFMPVFITAPSVAAARALLDKSSIVFGEKEAVAVKSSVIDARTIGFTVRNKDTKPFAGTLALTVNGKLISEALSLSPISERTIPVDITALVDESSARYAVRTAARVNAASGKELVNTSDSLNILFCNRVRTTIVIDGDLGDWTGYKAAFVGKDRADVIEYQQGKYTGADDVRAKFMCAYDDANLYLAVAVKDDVHYAPFSAKDLWRGDSLQIFIDASKDGTALDPKMDDDYAYMIGSSSEGNAAFRNFTPNKQIAWLENAMIEKAVTVKVVRDEARKTTVYEMQLPQRSIVPVALKKGGIIGLGIMVNDADEDKTDPKIPRKSAITTCSGKEGWMCPQNLSSFVFE